MTDPRQAHLNEQVDEQLLPIVQAVGWPDVLASLARVVAKELRAGLSPTEDADFNEPTSAELQKQLQKLSAWAHEQGF